MKTVLFIVLLIVSTAAFAQERDDAIFGDNGDTNTKDESSIEDRLKAQDDILQIGGMVYLRLDTNLTDGDSIDDQTLSMPSLVDVYLDARPNDRLRAFVRGRMRWNPSVPEEGATSLFGPSERTSINLDELWVRFDLERAVFVTIGQAKVRWGTTRIWNPVDVINTSRRAPLQPFDDRSGVPQIKLHIPIESLGWNLYALALTDSVTHFDEVGIASRAEIVFSTVELGLTGAWRKNVDPKAGVDVSAGIGAVDITGEVGLTFTDRVPTIQASAGIQYANKYDDEDVVYLGLEYFYNELGHDSLDDAILSQFTTSTVPDTITDDYVFNLFGGLQIFYIGKHYGAAFVSFPGLGATDDTAVTLSAIANFSDKSALARMDISTTFLTHLRVQAYVAAHLGQAGELRFGHDAINADFRTILLATMYPDEAKYELPTAAVDAGLYLRMDF